MINTDSILRTVRLSVGLTADYTAFDDQLILHTNTVLAILTHLGLGPKEGFEIRDDSTLWSELVSDTNCNMVKTYVGNKVRLIFDPPLSSVVVECMERQLKEMEWRIESIIDYEVSLKEEDTNV